MKISTKSLVLMVSTITLLIGLLVGFFVGRIMLEKKWARADRELSAADVKKYTADGADPVPPVGARILHKMPLGRARRAVKERIDRAPLVMTVGAVGNGDDGSELHLVLENKGDCTVTKFSGVAYGYDAWGMPAPMNKVGEPFVAFAGDAGEKGLEPGKKHLHAQKLRFTETASLAVAIVDSFECQNGKTWSRPR